MSKLNIRKKIESDDVPWNLLLIADPSKENINKYLNRGEIYLAYLENILVGTYVLTKENGNIVELKNIAVDLQYQGKGIGKTLVMDAIEKAKNQNVRRIIVGTGNSSLSQLTFYQKCGFRIFDVKKDFFIKNYTKEIIENGIICTDMIMLEIILK